MLRANRGGDRNGRPRTLTNAGTVFLGTSARLINSAPEAFICRGSQLALDAAISALALLGAFLVRFDGSVPAPHRGVMWSLVLLVPFVRPLMMLALGAYDAIWRYFNLRDAAVLAISAAPVSLLLLAVRYSLAEQLLGALIPAGVVLIDYLLFLLFAAGLRIFRRATHELSLPAASRVYRAILVGSEATLPQALRHLSLAPEIILVGLLAPEEEIQGLRIGGSLVMERPAALTRLLVSHNIDLVLVAESDPKRISETVAAANDFGVEVRLLPSAERVIRGEFRVSAIPAPEAAVQRSAQAETEDRFAAPDLFVADCVRDRIVLITGAGGSIGSELARQILALPAATIVLLDRDENSIFELSNELAVAKLQREHSPRVVPVIADVRDAAHISAIFEQHRPHIVFHAAAYKHVPIMENNVCEAMLNNVFGTRVVLNAALGVEAERMILISTDKAVHPSSVMGASKRVAEMLVGAQAAQGTHRTRLGCVRFGNVVGSRGSVAQIFSRQIKQGGPVTITDEHMTRYFMTIPEAAHLVLQAASLANGGSLFMLDMGDPMKITTFARKMIEHSGLRPGVDIEIKFVGARPGEKMSEELWDDDAGLRPTIFSRVLEVATQPPSADFSAALAALEEAAQGRDECGALEALRNMPIGFARSNVAPIAPVAEKAASLLVN